MFELNVVVHGGPGVEEGVPHHAHHEHGRVLLARPDLEAVTQLLDGLA